MGSMRTVVAAAGGLMVVAACNLGTPAVRHPGPSEAVAVSDVDADGDLDVVAGGAGGGLTLLNDGEGALSGTPHVASTEVRAVAVGDVDGDGAVDRLDLVGSGVDVALGDGTGGLSVPVPVPGDPPGDVINDVTLADLDADDDLDLVTAGSGGARFRLNDGAGAFGPRDIPGIPCGAASTGYVRSSARRPAPSTSTGTTTSTSRADRLLRQARRRHPLLRDRVQRRPGHLQPGAAEGGLAVVGVGAWASAYADVDEDGYLDRIVGDPDSPVVEITIGRDPRAPGPTPPDVVLSIPTPAPAPSVGSPPTSTGTATSTPWSRPPGSGTATVLYGDGTGAFPDRHPLGTGGSSVESVEAADLDGDGRTDLVFGTDNAGRRRGARRSPCSRKPPRRPRAPTAAAHSPRLRGGCEGPGVRR